MLMSTSEFKTHRKKISNCAIQMSIQIRKNWSYCACMSYMWYEEGREINITVNDIEYRSIQYQTTFTIKLWNSQAHFHRKFWAIKSIVESQARYGNHIGPSCLIRERNLLEFAENHKITNERGNFYYQLLKCSTCGFNIYIQANTIDYMKKINFVEKIFFGRLSTVVMQCIDMYVLRK